MNVGRELWRNGESDEPLVIAPEGIWTYGAGRARAASIAVALSGRGLKPGDRVAVFLDRQADAVASDFAVVASGGVVVMIHDGLRPRQIERAVADCGAQIIVTSRDMLSRLPRPLTTGAAFLLLETVPEDHLAGEWQPVVTTPDDTAQIIYTSGSTGLPKGVVLTHGNISAHMQVVSSLFRLRSRDRTIGLLPFSSVYGISQMLCAVASGGSLVIERSPMMSRIAATIREREVTVLAAVPSLWFQLLECPQFSSTPITSLRVLQNAGGHLPVQAVRRIRAAQPDARLFLMYGMTEAMRCTALSPDEVDQRPDSIGRPIAGARVSVVRADGMPCNPDEAGELVVAGPTVARGYWNDPVATARTFRVTSTGQRTVHTGDIVRCNEDGYLTFVGRQDRMIKSLGHRIGPDEVIDALLSSGMVIDAGITTEPDSVRGEAIVGHVVLRPGASMRALDAFCQAELPRWLRPARFESYPAMPRTSSGKTDLVALAGRHDRENARAAIA